MIFSSIFRTPILCCTTTDLGILGIFGTVLGILGVAFVRALAGKVGLATSLYSTRPTYCTWYLGSGATPSVFPLDLVFLHFI